MAEFTRWEDYFYPPPNDDTLRNKFGIRNFWELRDLDYAMAAQRETQLRAGMVDIPRTFDAAHIKAIHRYVFQDVYSWAGETRRINMRRAEDAVGFAGVRNGAIESYLKGVKEIVAMTDWSAVDREQFAEAAAQVFAWLNQAHPFREGNGRASRIFMDHVAELSPFELDRSLVSKEEWDRASAASRPASHTSAPQWEELVAVFSKMTVDRPTETSLEAAEALISVLQASYPQAAVDLLKRRTGPAAAAAAASAPLKDYGAGIGD